jgi:hypothetical protein
MFGMLSFFGIVLVAASFGVAYAMEDESRSVSTAVPVIQETVENITPTPAPEPTAVPTPEPPPPPPPPPPANRADCNVIRGTSYLSADERTWFLANCRSG